MDDANAGWLRRCLAFMNLQVPFVRVHQIYGRNIFN